MAANTKDIAALLEKHKISFQLMSLIDSPQAKSSNVVLLSADGGLRCFKLAVNGCAQQTKDW